MENIHKKTNGHTWKYPYSAPCPGLFPATLRSSILSFLLQFNPYSFPQNPQKNSSPLHHAVPSPFLFLSLYLRFAFPMISAAATFFLPHFLSRLPTATFPATFSAATFSVPLLLQLQKARLIPSGH